MHWWRTTTSLLSGLTRRRCCASSTQAAALKRVERSFICLSMNGPMSLGEFWNSNSPIEKIGKKPVGDPAYQGKGLGVDEVTLLSNGAKSIFSQLLSDLSTSHWNFNRGHGNLTLEDLWVISAKRIPVPSNKFFSSDDIKVLTNPYYPKETPYGVANDIAQIWKLMNGIWKGYSYQPDDVEDFMSLAMKLSTRLKISLLEFQTLANHSVLWQPSRWLETLCSLHASRSISQVSSHYSIPPGGYDDPVKPPPDDIPMHSAIRYLHINDRSAEKLISTSIAKEFKNARWLSILPKGDRVLLDILFHGHAEPSDAIFKTPYQLYVEGSLPDIYCTEVGALIFARNSMIYAADRQRLRWNPTQKFRYTYRLMYSISHLLSSMILIESDNLGCFIRRR